GLRLVVRGRHGGCVPSREPGPDGDAAPTAAALLLRLGGGGRVDPARTDPRRVGAPVLAAAERRRRRHVYPSAHEAVAGEEARRAAVSRTVDAACGRLRGLYRGRGGSVAASDGIEAFASPYGADARAVDARDGCARHYRRHRRGDLYEARSVLVVWFSRESL